MNKHLILDPKGYFLIRITDNEVEVGFCHYKDMVWKKSTKEITEKDELLFLMEEIGEMAEAVRKINGNKRNK